MKIKSFFFVCLLASSLCSYSQPCLSGGIVITNQSQIDDFPTNFPACTQIQGDVKITGDNIVNLDGLSNLTSISGMLTIQEISIQTALDDLNNLDSVGGRILITNNNSLTILNGFNNLTYANGHVLVSNNPALISLDGFAKLIVSKTFQIANNPLIESLSSQGMFENIAPDGELYIGKNPKLTNVAGLQSLTQVEGSIKITENESLTSLDSLIHLTSVGNSFIISLNPKLPNLSGLDNLTTVDYMDIFSNDTLANINHLSNLKEADELKIRENPALINLEGLSNFQTITNVFQVIGNTNLENIGTLGFSDTLDGGIFIAANPKLTNIAALNSLTTVKGYIGVTDHESLTDLAGLSNLRKVSGLAIHNNPLITSLSDLSQLDSVSENLGIGYMSVPNLKGLENLHFVGGTLFITSNPNLTSLSGLENLRHLKELEIKNNPLLTSVSALDSAEFAAGLDGLWIQLKNNPLLSFCNALSICKRMAVHWGWTVFSDNAEGCNNQGEVLLSCGLSDTDDQTADAEINIYPNPTSGVFVVEIENPTRFKIQVLDNIGRLVETQEMLGVGILDLSDKAEGVYFVRLLFDEQMVVRKIVKI